MTQLRQILGDWLEPPATGFLASQSGHQQEFPRWFWVAWGDRRRKHTPPGHTPDAVGASTPRPAQGQGQEAADQGLGRPVVTFSQEWWPTPKRLNGHWNVGQAGWAGRQSGRATEAKAGWRQLLKTWAFFLPQLHNANPPHPTPTSTPHHPHITTPLLAHPHPSPKS